MTSLLLSLLCLAQGEGGLAEPPSATPEVQAQGADPRLLEEVRKIASRIETLRGARFASPPIALRAGQDLRRAAATARVGRVLPSERLAARGRAWADVGLGTADTPARVLQQIAADLPEIALEADGRRLLVAPDMLSDPDLSSEDPEDPAATIFRTTGMRPDEPLVAHVLVHALQRERMGSDSLRDTTDQLLAAAAWAEGEANLAATRYVFRAIRVGDEVFEGGGVDPLRMMGGRLVGAALEALPAVDRSFLSFVYEEGFAETTRLYRKGGWRAVEQAAASRNASSDLFHPDRAGERRQVLSPASLPEPFAPVDADVLGEQGIIALVATLTGKDDLALVAGDGWVSDALVRGERGQGGDPDDGITIWDTKWRSPSEATEFDYAYGRSLEDGLAAVRLEDPAPGRRAWKVGSRVYRMERKGDRVVVRVAPPELDRRMETPGGPKKPQNPTRGAPNS